METGIIIAMEMCDEDLDELLRKRASLQKPLSQKEVIDFLYQISK